MADVAFDSNTPATRDAAGGFTKTHSHTCSGVDRYIEGFCLIQNNSAPGTITATYGGVSMTLEGSQIVYNAVPSNTWTMYKFTLVNPPSGANDMVFTRANNTGLFWSASTSYNNVNQTTPQQVSANGRGSSGSPSTLSLTTSSPAFWTATFANIDNNYAGVSGEATILRDTGGSFRSLNTGDSNGMVGAKTANIQLTYTGSRDWGGFATALNPTLEAKNGAMRAFF